MQSEVGLDTGGEIVNAIEFLIRAYEFDLNVLIYIPLMLLKWWVLTCPLWVPLAAVMKTFSGSKGNQ